MIARAVAGIFVAGSIALIAKRASSLSASGAAAATLVGALAVAVEWSWGGLLIAYFAASTILSRIGRTAKQKRTASIVAKGGARDAVQVLANGGLFAGASIALLAQPDIRWIALGAGALAASASDTWATEVGTLWGGEPRSILSWRPVPAGTSGGITLIGTVGALAGAVFVALATIALGWTRSLGIAVAVGGVTGAIVDSLLGATMQARRWCDTCNLETECITHDCGSPTRHKHGWPWLDNDVVNFVSTVAGGLVATLLAR